MRKRKLWHDLHSKLIEFVLSNMICPAYMTFIIFDVCKILWMQKTVTLQWEQFCVKNFVTLCVEACVNKLLIKRICISTIVDLSFPLKNNLFCEISMLNKLCYLLNSIRICVCESVCMCFVAIEFTMCVFLHQWSSDSIEKLRRKN